MPYSTVYFRMTLSDPEWLSTISNDMKLSAVSLRQLSFLYSSVIFVLYQWFMIWLPYLFYFKPCTYYISVTRSRFRTKVHTASGVVCWLLFLVPGIHSFWSLVFVTLQGCFFVCSFTLWKNGYLAHRIDGYWLWNRAIKFTRWQHRPMGRGARFAICSVLFSYAFIRASACNIVNTRRYWKIFHSLFFCE